MTLKGKLSSDSEGRAVSPVIGVILMVAITVILAAVIATFVMDIGDLDEGAPNAQFDWEVQTYGSDDYLTVTHTSGKDIETSELSFSDSIDWDDGSGADRSDIDNGDTWSAGKH